MGEQAPFIAAAVFITVLTVPMVRLGRSLGGRIWALAWFVLFLSGVAVVLSAEHPAFAPFVPALGTAFATLFFGGTLLFTRRVSRFPIPLVVLGGCVAAVRIATQPLISEVASQVVGAVVITSAVVASMVVLFRPRGRSPTSWERILGFTISAVALSAMFNAACFAFGWPSPPIARLWFLLVGIAVAVLQVAAIIAHTAERLAVLRTEAARTRDAHDDVSQRYRELTENASDMISEIDEHGTILYANPAHEQVLGYTPSQMIGQPASVLFDVGILSPENRASFEALFSTRSELQMVTVRHANGEERILECSARAFLPESGPRRIVVTSRDATARRKEEKRLQKGRDELESLVEDQTAALQSSLLELERSQRLASIGTLTAGIAHQINNPIGSIQMSSEFALRSEDEEDERAIWREALQNNVEQARRCGRIVSSMLQFARNEPTVKSEEDVEEILRHVCDQTAAYGRNRLAKIDTSGIAGPLPIHGSAIELEQALLNILQNAAESSTEAVRIEIRAERVGGQARITISDDGCGMAQAEADHAFDPFFTTRLGRGGTGLGLSVAHGVVMNHGGLLSIESEKDVGTRVTLSIPLRAVAEEEGANQLAS